MSIKYVHSKRKLQGFTLIEAMVALTLTAIGLLGQMSLQMNSLQGNQSAYQRSQATFLAADILDRMRANQYGVTQGNYDAIDTAVSYASPGCINNTVGCSAQKLALEDKAEWTSNVKKYLLNGSTTTGSATITGDNGVFTITIKWGNGKKLSGVSLQDSALYNQLVLTARLL